MRRATRAAILAAALGAAACGASDGSAPALIESVRLQSGRFSRTYTVSVPSSYRQGRAAAVLMAFGGGGNGEGMRSATGLDPIAQRSGTIVVYPDALPEARGQWGLGCFECTLADALGADDDRFAIDVLDDVARRYTVDPQRVYATGHSIGGSFANLLVCRHSDRFAGATIVASLLIEQEERDCRPVRPLRFLLMIGTEDPNLPWAGGGRYGYVGAEATAALWADRDGCRQPVTTEQLADRDGDGHRTVVFSYGTCAAGTVVRLYRMEGFGHDWPSGRDVSASEEIDRWLLSARPVASLAAPDEGGAQDIGSATKR